MSNLHRTYMNWSSGKDAALALYHLQKESLFQVEKLITSVNTHYNRVTMHGLRIELVIQQAKAIGIPLELIRLPKAPSMETYNEILTKKVGELVKEGYQHTAFGDIFLEDLRKYREEQLKPFGIKAHFPLWGRDTRNLMYELLELGFKAIVVCINGEKLDKSFVGREIDEQFIKDLPKNVDPCGENGEYHTFCYDGPIFSKPITFKKGEITKRTYPKPKTSSKNQAETIDFWFCDLLT